MFGRFYRVENLCRKPGGSVADISFFSCHHSAKSLENFRTPVLL